MKSWVDGEQDPVLFWKLTPREIETVFSGIASREERRYNQFAQLAHRIAYMGTYAPKKPEQFWKLKTLLWKSDKPAAEKKQQSWKDSFAAFSSWAKSKGKT